ncbi:PREDICTED: uncharacterized protein LOC109129543 [Camelina sativa]|uniref:Uncharacterized protein LOC109129543 n=1 Tax=Camelina sativa TaxID=90675 RepID=A0ABM1R2Y3_CAMSA|nr:PREDICTED: uncharacterized protein LOC109129543 [Camelina sativa]
MKTSLLMVVAVLLITCLCSSSKIGWAGTGSSAQPMYPDHCWNDMKRFPGCLENIKGIFHFPLREIRKECCLVVNSFSDTCWPIIFPSMPYIRFMIKGICLIKPGLH